MSDVCIACGKTIPPTTQGHKTLYHEKVAYLCYLCDKESKKTDDLEAFIKARIELRNKRQIEIEKVKLQEQKRYDEIILTTSPAISDMPVKEYKGIIGAQVMAGINVFKDAFAGIRNIVGGRSEALQNSMKKMREQVLLELKEEAFKIGANAIIATRLDFDEYAGNMLMLTAYGTAVIISTPDS